jgi:hypothetical protein
MLAFGEWNAASRNLPLISVAGNVALAVRLSGAFATTTDPLVYIGSSTRKTDDEIYALRWNRRSGTGFSACLYSDWTGFLHGHVSGRISKLHSSG